jgi:L-2,4-diaminobutyrate decarboxylase
MTQAVESRGNDEGSNGRDDEHGSPEFSDLFLNESNLYEHVNVVAGLLGMLTKRASKEPYSGSAPGVLAATLTGIDPIPEDGIAIEELVGDVEFLIDNSISLTHPRTIGHLISPPVVPALQAEVLVSALNQSLDVFETSPVATMFEKALVARICQEVKFPPGAGGTFTPGGTHSNYAALLLARDFWLYRHLGWSAKRSGIPPLARNFRILCSAAAHYSIEKAAAQLGLGTEAVVRIKTDRSHRISPELLRSELDSLRRQGKVPVALVATAGTTDFGAIDDLSACAEIAADASIWLHVDAAYGGGLVLADSHRDRLRGINFADSVSIDFHKMLWQPASCGLLLLRESSRFQLTTHRADYLNPSEHAVEGIPDLVDMSLLTTRRFDAFKVWLSLRRLGRHRLDDMVSHVLALAQRAWTLIDEQDKLMTLHRPELGCVVFRFVPQSEHLSDAINRQVQRTLMETGKAMIATTRVEGRVCLKLTLLSPLVREPDLRELITEIAGVGRDVESKLAEVEERVTGGSADSGSISAEKGMPQPRRGERTW